MTFREEVVAAQPIFPFHQVKNAVDWTPTDIWAQSLLMAAISKKLHLPCQKVWKYFTAGSPDPRKPSAVLYPGAFRAGHWSECISALALGHREEITSLEGAAPGRRILMLKGCGTKLVVMLAFVLLPLETGKKAIGQCRRLLESSLCFCRARRTHTPGFLCSKKG